MTGSMKPSSRLFERAADECITWSERAREEPWWTLRHWQCRYQAHVWRSKARRLFPFYEWREAAEEGP